MNKKNQQMLIQILKETGLNAKFQRFCDSLDKNQTHKYIDIVEEVYALSRISQNLNGSDIDKYKESQKRWLNYLVLHEQSQLKPYIDKYGRKSVQDACVWLVDNYKWESPIWNNSLGRISVYTWDYLKCIDEAITIVREIKQVEEVRKQADELIEQAKEQEESVITKSESENMETLSIDKAREQYDVIENAMKVLGNFLMQDIESSDECKDELAKKDEEIAKKDAEILALSKYREQAIAMVEKLKEEQNDYKQRIDELEGEVLRYVSEIDKIKNQPKSVKFIPYSELTSLPLIGEKAASVLIPFFEKRLAVKFQLDK